MCPSTDELIKKMCCTFAVEYLLNHREHKPVIYRKMGELLNKTHQIQKDKYERLGRWFHG